MALHPLQPEQRGPADTPQRFVVVCIRSDGKERIFNSYATRERAESVAAALRNVGCQARAIGPDELALDEPRDDRGPDDRADP